VETGVSVVRLEPGSPERFVPLRRQLGVTAFGINQMLLRPGQRGRIHRHERQEEAYVVLEGELTLVIEGDEEHTLAYGDAARVAPEVRRQLINRGTGRLAILAMGGATPHDGRDGMAFLSWEDGEPKSPADVPLPDDVK
jgi:uncharacterized cupin superfamily protein